ncbi:MAG: sugar phosphate isomerase/epimerase family protein [Salinibacter sp.]
MHRRSFLERLGAGAAALSGLTLAGAGRPPGTVSTAASETARPARVRMATKFHMLESEAPVRERFRTIRDAGFAGVEFRSPNDYDTKAIVEAQEATGLEVIGVVAGWKNFGSTDPATLKQSHEELRTALQDASDYGASLVLLVPETVDAEMPYDQAYDQSIREIRKALPRAETLGVQIGIENVWNNFLLSPREFASYVDAFESTWLGAYFDVGNVAKHGWPEQWIRILGDRILRLDVKGFSTDLMNKQGPGAGFEADIGEGTIDWAAVRTALDDIGYDGWAVAEESGGDAARLQAVAGQMTRVLPTA